MVEGSSPSPVTRETAREEAQVMMTVFRGWKGGSILPLRLTLSTSMVVIIALGVSLASLREANRLLLTVVSGTTVAALTLSVLIA